MMGHLMMCRVCVWVCCLLCVTLRFGLLRPCVAAPHLLRVRVIQAPLRAVMVWHLFLQQLTLRQ